MLTETFSTYIYTKSFSTFQQGQASYHCCIYVPDRHGADGYQLKIYYKKDKKEMS